MKKMIFTLARYLTCAFTDMIHYRFKKCEFPGIPLSGIQVTRGFLIKQKHFYPSTITKVYLYYFDILLEYCNGVRQNFQNLLNGGELYILRGWGRARSHYVLILQSSRDNVKCFGEPQADKCRTVQNSSRFAVNCYRIIGKGDNNNELIMMVFLVFLLLFVLWKAS